MTTVILFVFGAIIGSFLNVVGLRFNSGLTLHGRSRCPNCRKTLRFYELVPILSFVFSGGRCRGCKAKISWQYPFIEALTGTIFATLFMLPLPVLLRAIMLIVFSIYIVIMIYDWRHKIIPDSLAYSAVGLALVFRIFAGGTSLDWLAGPILFLFFASIWLVSRGKAMGFGDAKLAVSVGLLLGAAAGFSAIILAFWIGAIFGIGLLAFARLRPLLRKGKDITMKSEIPFAPFIITGAWLAAIWELDLLHVSLF